MESHLVRGFRWGSQEFRFELCHRREVVLGPATIDQWWMLVPPLYGQRRGGTPPPHNHREILRLYWATVEHSESTQSQKAQECYLLASLVPLVRAEGSRTIFADAFLKPALPRQTQEVVQTLQAQLQAGCESQLSRAEFHTKSWDALGRLDYPEGVRQIYECYTRELLEAPCRLLAAGDREPALQLAAHLERLDEVDLPPGGACAGKVGVGHPLL